MSADSAYQFMEKAYSDPKWRAELQKETDVDGLVAKGKAAGYNFTPDELRSAATKFYEDKGIELSDDQLEAAAGGHVVATIVKA